MLPRMAAAVIIIRSQAYDLFYVMSVDLPSVLPSTLEPRFYFWPTKLYLRNSPMSQIRNVAAKVASYDWRAMKK